MGKRRRRRRAPAIRCRMFPIKISEAKLTIELTLLRWYAMGYCFGLLFVFADTLDMHLLRLS